VGENDADGSVHAIVLSGPKMYAGGSFESIGEEPRPHLAALDPLHGEPTPWNPMPNGDVSTLALAPDGSLWAGGSFTGFPGIAQSGVARFAPLP
jgi:hypothetical protein